MDTPPHLLALGIIVSIIAIATFTVLYGRIFCGWIYPQTIFMEMVFRRIEYWIEGDANAQRKLKRSKWTNEKSAKRTLKHSIFITISLLISHTFLSYIVGIEAILEIVIGSPLNNFPLFMGLMVFTGLFYGVFAFFREQVCTNVCPYGRLQSVLLGRDSIVVAYDHVRGEPRGRMKSKKKADAPALGDCIDCKLCVQVCPTGIDIRNGTQLECVNCTACIDACDSIMDKLGKERGLVRYASHKQIEEKIPFKLSPRMIAYSILLTLMMGVVSYFLLARTTVETTVLRAPGQLYQRMDSGNIRNLYTFQVVNKTSGEIPVTLRLANPKGDLEIAGMEEGEVIKVEEEGMFSGAFFIEMPKSELEGLRNEVRVEVLSNGELIETVKANFMAPMN
ncbi:MAG: cytochrome c oxidase accessory protein CcoG [Bacteroidota bacterium]